MNDNFPIALAHVLADEGSFVNNPRDPGGMTNLGVTKNSWEKWTKHFVNEEEMRSLTPSLVAPFYRDWFWLRGSCDKLPVGVDYAVFDCAVNSGPGRAAKILQASVGAVEDGFIGARTLVAVFGAFHEDANFLIGKFTNLRLEFLQTLPTWPAFGAGWTARINRVEQRALQMISSS